MCRYFFLQKWVVNAIVCGRSKYTLHGGEEWWRYILSSVLFLGVSLRDDALNVRSLTGWAQNSEIVHDIAGCFHLDNRFQAS